MARHQASRVDPEDYAASEDHCDRLKTQLHKVQAELRREQEKNRALTYRVRELSAQLGERTFSRVGRAQHRP